MAKPDAVILSSSPLTDRMLVHTNFLEVLGESVDVRIWGTSKTNPRFDEMWLTVPARAEAFPPINEFPEWINVLRRINEAAWDHVLRDPSRLSKMRNITHNFRSRIMRRLGEFMGALGMHEWLENRLVSIMTAYDRSPNAARQLELERPDLIVCTGTFRYEEPAVVGAAKKLGIPVLGLITSWDNISVKNRMVFPYDGYIVWSDQMKRELLEYYPQSSRVPIYKMGAPQFDMFFQTKWHLSREEFCRRLNLNPDLPIVLHALGVAHGVEEHYGAVDLAQRIVRGELGDVQLIIRPHPFNNHLELRELFNGFAPRVVLQQYGSPKDNRNFRSQDEDQVVEWINTFRHSDVVVHRSSTVAVDAAIVDRPSICMDYDPAPGQPKQQLVKDVNHLWTHYKPIVESGGTRLVGSPAELASAIQDYLRDPSQDREARRRMALHVCGYLDGRCGQRMAEAVLDFFRTHVPTSATPAAASPGLPLTV